MSEIPVTQMRHSREPLFMLPLNETSIEDLAPSKLPESNILRYSSDSLYLYVATTKLLVECPKLIINVQQQHLRIVGYVSSNRVWNYSRGKNQPSANRRIEDTYSQVLEYVCYTLPIQPNPRIQARLRNEIPALTSFTYFHDFETPQRALFEISMLVSI
jgi:hypothetical protein